MGTSATQNVNAGDKRQSVQITSDYAITNADDVVLVYDLAAPCALSLPTPIRSPVPPSNPVGWTAVPQLGQEHDVEDTDGSGVLFAITITPLGGALINGAPFFVLPGLARAKLTWVPSLAAGAGGWTAKLYEPGGGFSVPLVGNVNGPSNANHVDELSGPGAGAPVILDAGISIKQTQGGTLAAPATEYPLIFPVRDPTRAAWSITQGAAAWAGGVIDNYFGSGYNMNNVVATEPSASESTEVHYAPVLLADITEKYWSMNRAGGTLGVRPFAISYNNVTGDTTCTVNTQGTGAFDLLNAATQYGQIVYNLGTFAMAVQALKGDASFASTVGGATLQGATTASMLAPNCSIASTAIGGGNEFTGDSTYTHGRATAAGTVLDYRYGLGSWNYSADDNLFDLGIDEKSIEGTARRWRRVRAITALFGAANGIGVDQAGSVGSLCMANVTTAPTSTPVGGFVAWSNANGALIVRDELGADSNVTGGFFSQAMADAPQTISAANS
ncbi:MAG: hypothetical protein ACHREM_21635, partial [Polyangiales bacterium]